MTSNTHPLYFWQTILLVSAFTGLSLLLGGSFAAKDSEMEAYTRKAFASADKDHNSTITAGEFKAWIGTFLGADDVNSDALLAKFGLAGM